MTTTTPTNTPKFKKLSNGWHVETSERIDVDGGHDVIAVSMRDGTTKNVKLTRTFTRRDGMYYYVPVADKRPVTTARGPQIDRYDNHYGALGVCTGCEFNADAGDGRGCPHHRGNPRA